MALIVPFRGIHYNLKKIGDPNQVVAPPYDVISPEEQKALYQRHPQNIIRLILNQETPEDSPQDNRYTRSAACYHEWLEKEILLRSSQPTFYFLREEFDPSGSRHGVGNSLGKKVRQGFIGLVRLEEFGKGIVLPHEKTQTKPKADRLALMEACRANFSQIFALYSDEEGAMSSIYHQVFSSAEGPTLDILDDNGIRHSLWSINNHQILSKITEIMRSKNIFIADGHHRYETALVYRDRQRFRFPLVTGKETHHYTMMYLTALESDGLLILPTHRVVTSLKEFQASSFITRLDALFSVESFSFDDRNEEKVRDIFLQQLAARANQRTTFGMLLKEINQFFLLSLKNDQAMGEAAPALSTPLKSLDVNLLHVLILQKLLAIGPQELAAGKNISYFQNPLEAIEAVQAGKGQIAFFLNSTKVSQVKEVSLAGETMPPKSTFFYPKLLSGLLINPLEPDEQIDSG